MSLWKVSVYDEKLGGYVVKRVGLSCKSAAENCAELFKRDGYITRISPILPDAVEDDITSDENKEATENPTKTPAKEKNKQKDKNKESELMASKEEKTEKGSDCKCKDIKKELEQVNTYNGVILDVLESGTKEASKIAKSLLQKNIDRVNAIIEK